MTREGGAAAFQQAPRNFDALRALIASGETGLPRRLAQAAEYALAHPEEFALGTAASIADAAQVQPSTMVRLARHLGYEGFSDLQAIFRDRLKLRASTYEERLRKIEAGMSGDSYEGALLNGFLAAARKSVDDLANTFSTSEFGRAVGLLAQAETIYLVARRRAFPLASHMAYAFGKLRIRAVTVGSPNGIDAEIVAGAGTGDAAIACSFSPYAPDSIEHARTLAEAGVPVVAITDSALSPLTALASCWLEVSESDFAGFRSLSASMALATALPVAIAERRRYRS